MTKIVGKPAAHFQDIVNCNSKSLSLWSCWQNALPWYPCRVVRPVECLSLFGYIQIQFYPFRCTTEILVHRGKEAYLTCHLTRKQGFPEHLIHSASEMNRVAVHFALPSLFSPDKLDWLCVIASLSCPASWLYPILLVFVQSLWHCVVVGIPLLPHEPTSTVRQSSRRPRYLLLSVRVFLDRLREWTAQMDAPRFVSCIFGHHALLVDTGEDDGYAWLWKFGDAEKVCGVDLAVVAMGGFEHVQGIFIRVVACAVDVLPET
jgi:hypothetical protein